jgi:hypothetical protein
MRFSSNLQLLLSAVLSTPMHTQILDFFLAEKEKVEKDVVWAVGSQCAFSPLTLNEH